MPNKIEYFEFGADGGGATVWLLDSGEVEESGSSMGFEDEPGKDWLKKFPSWPDWWQQFKRNHGSNWISFHVVYIHPDIRRFIRAEVKAVTPANDWQIYTKKRWLSMSRVTSPIKITEINSLHFFIGGYFATNIDIFIKNGTLISNQYKFRPESGDKSERKLTLDELRDLITSMNDVNVTEWEKNYSAPVLDGTQWSLKLIYNGRKRFSSHGSNAYPSRFDYFCKTIEDICGFAKNGFPL